MIIKVKNKPGFAQIQNNTLRDKRLSLEARGALCEMLSYSEGFKADVRSLMRLWGITREKLLRITNQLKQYGYLEIIPVRDARGQIIDMEWNFYGESQGKDFRSFPPVENSGVENFQRMETPDVGYLQSTENPDVGKNLRTENPHHIYKDESSQKEEYKESETHTEKPPPPTTKELETQTEKQPPVGACVGVDDKYGVFRDQLEDWWCRLHGIITLPPDINTAQQVRWLFDNKFTLSEIRQFYEYATTDPEEKSWRTGNVTLGAIVKGIARWKLDRQQTALVHESPKRDFSKCPDCRGSGLKPVIIENVRVGSEKCRHPGLAVSSIGVSETRP